MVSQRITYTLASISGVLAMFAYINTWKNRNIYIPLKRQNTYSALYIYIVSTCCSEVLYHTCIDVQHGHRSQTGVNAIYLIRLF
jgi:hypothetical protein